MLKRIPIVLLLLLPFLKVESQEADTGRISIHQTESNTYSKTSFPKSPETEKISAFPSNLITKTQENLQTKILGWHPYWVSQTAHINYDYEALSHIAYFSYELDTASGGYISIHEWNSTPIIDYAHQRGVRVLLTVTNFGTSANTKLLSDTVKQKLLISNIITLLKNRNGDGVNFDLESVPLSQRTNLVNFIKRAVTSIKAVLPAAEISMAAPAVDWSGSWNLAALSQLCDYLIIMGYDYYWKGSSTAGPVAPLEGENYNVTKSVNSYLASGVPSGKLMLGVPWYGYDWPVVSVIRKASATGSATARVFTAATLLAESNNKNFDLTTKVPWVSYSISSTYRQLWFDDTQSLAMKYELVKSKNLAGVGIWALSYEGGNKEMWSTFQSVFSPASETENKIIKIYPNPSGGHVKIDFYLTTKQYFSLKIYDTFGRLINVVTEKELDAGSYSEETDLIRFGAGIYLCVLQTGNSINTKKIVVTK